jgi:hypothetical protein
MIGFARPLVARRKFDTVLPALGSGSAAICLAPTGYAVRALRLPLVRIAL